MKKILIGTIAVIILGSLMLVFNAFKGDNFVSNIPSALALVTNNCGNPHYAGHNQSRYFRTDISQPIILVEISLYRDNCGQAYGHVDMYNPGQNLFGGRSKCSSK